MMGVMAEGVPGKEELGDEAGESEKPNEIALPSDCGRDGPAKTAGRSISR